MINFDEYSDEELVDIARNGETEAVEQLMSRYKGLVKGKASRMYLVGADKDDLIQEGMLGLYKAFRDYDPGRDANFKTFADLCVARQMYTAIEASGRKKHLPLNGYISLWDHDEDCEKDSILTEIQNAEQRNPEDILIDKENVEDIENIIEQELSEFERKVLDLSMTGLSYVEIARVLGVEKKSVDNALNRMKNKIRKALDNLRKT